VGNLHTTMNNDKLAQACALIDTFRAATSGTVESPQQPNPLDISVFKENILKMGGIDDATRAMIKEEDLAEIGIPKLLARRLVAVFQENGATAEDPSRPFVSNRQADRMSFTALLERYSPEEENAVSKKLAELSKGHAFIVFADGGKVNVFESNRILHEVRKFGPIQDNITFVKDRPTRVYKVGELADEFISENPLFAGRALRPGEICEFTRLSWEGVPQETRLILALAVRETHELSVTVEKAFDLIEAVRENPAWVNTRCRKAVLMLDELKKTNSAPSLMVKPRRAAAKRQDPFNTGAQ